jgi:uncharacterized short protein YbdD (DUF466 family)
VINKLKSWWQTIRQLSGDDLYERYLHHHSQYHSGQPPQSREMFFKQWQDEKWTGVKRCC